MNKVKTERISYVTKEERKKLQRVVRAFMELYQEEDIAVTDAGRYGFVKVQFYKAPFGFSDVFTFTDSKELFEDLWKEWRNTQLLSWAKGTPIVEMEYKDIFKCMPLKNQKMIIKKKHYFEKKAGLRKGRIGQMWTNIVDIIKTAKGNF